MIQGQGHQNTDNTHIGHEVNTTGGQSLKYHYSNFSVSQQIYKYVLFFHIEYLKMFVQNYSDWKLEQVNICALHNLAVKVFEM